MTRFSYVFYFLIHCQTRRGSAIVRMEWMTRSFGVLRFRDVLLGRLASGKIQKAGAKTLPKLPEPLVFKTCPFALVFKSSKKKTRKHNCPHPCRSDSSKYFG